MGDEKRLDLKDPRTGDYLELDPYVASIIRGWKDRAETAEQDLARSREIVAAWRQSRLEYVQSLESMLRAMWERLQHSTSAGVERWPEYATLKDWAECDTPDAKDWDPL